MDLRRISDANETAGAGDASSNTSLCLSPSTDRVNEDRDREREELLRKFENTLAENMLLKHAMQNKAEQIVNLKSKLLEMMERRAREPEEDPEMSYRRASAALNRTQEILADLDNPEFSAGKHGSHGHDLSGAGIADETRALAITFSESMIEWVGENKDDVLEKFGTGSFHATELVAGGVAGWLTAFALKTFGKMAVTALGGGLFLIQLAHHKGYIVVNWNGIYDEIQNKLDFTKAQPEPSPNVSARESFHELGPTSRVKESRLNFIRHWSVNTFSVMGFVGGFVYKTYT